jgi:hypothetical protein
MSVYYRTQGSDTESTYWVYLIGVLARHLDLCKQLSNNKAGGKGRGCSLVQNRIIEFLVSSSPATACTGHEKGLRFSWNARKL